MKVEELMEMEKEDNSSTKNSFNQHLQQNLQYRIKRDTCGFCYGIMFIFYWLSGFSIKITTFLENIFYRYIKFSYFCHQYLMF